MRSPNADPPGLAGAGDSGFGEVRPGALPGETRFPRGSGGKKLQATRNQNPPCGVEQAKRSKNDAKGLTMLISTLALAMSIAMMVSAIVILYNETVARKQKRSFE